MLKNKIYKILNKIMGQNISINRINFENIQKLIKNKNTNTNDYLLINTLANDNQECLILNTISANNEVEIINNYLKSNKKNVNIIIYGMNCSDISIVKKYNQLYKLGFKNLYIYIGGLFEWLLLQDIYGDEEFPTTNKILDILKYKGKLLNM